MTLPFDMEETWMITTRPVRTAPPPPVGFAIDEATFYCLELGKEISVTFKPLIDELRAEIRSTEAGYPHYTTSGRVQGCTGPMCKKAKRDWELQHRHRTAAAEGKTIRRRARSEELLFIDPIIQSFYNFWIDK